MRLKKIQQILLDNSENLNIINKNTTSSGWTTIPEYTKLIGAINNIKVTGIIDKQFTLFENEGFFAMTNANNARFEKDRFSKLHNLVETISAKTEAVLITINQVLPQSVEDNSALVVNLPGESFTLPKFKSIVDKLDKLTKSLNKLEFEDSEKHSEEPVVSHFDVGSEWVVLTLSFIGLIPVLIKAANDIQDFRIKNRQIKILDHELNKLGLDDDTREKLSSAIDKIDQKIGEELAPDVMKNSPLVNTPENTATLMQVIKQLDNLLASGVSFERGVNIETEQQESFPPIAEQKKLSKIDEIDTIKNISNNES